uniref:Uncharacterized protein n=1 Tax=Zooxanthella nutricula TaxID=1333877 RepID=A0A7S2LEU0_9DINO
MKPYADGLQVNGTSAHEVVGLGTASLPDAPLLVRDSPPDAALLNSSAVAAITQLLGAVAGAAASAAVGGKLVEGQDVQIRIVGMQDEPRNGIIGLGSCRPGEEWKESDSEPVEGFFCRFWRAQPEDTPWTVRTELGGPRPRLALGEAIREGSPDHGEFQLAASMFASETDLWYTSVRAVGFQVDRGFNFLRINQATDVDFNAQLPMGAAALLDSGSAALRVSTGFFEMIRRSMPGGCRRSSNLPHAHLECSCGSVRDFPSVTLSFEAAGNVRFWGLDGGAVLSDFDLGHGPGRTLTHMAVSPSQDRHYVVTADDDGVIRVHALKIDVKKEKRGATAAGGDSEKEHAKEPVTLSTNFTASFNLPTNPGGAARNLTSVLAIDRGSQSFVVTGDSIGGISVFFKNGTLKGRVRVTEDPGGVLGLVRAQGQTVLFFTAYSFGFFSTAQIDLQQPPCAGWNSPLFDIAVDPSSSSSKVILALSDGDILVFSTASGKSKSCDLTLKFPHVSTLPFKLHPFRGHIMALPILSPDTVQKAERVRDIFFFNMAAMGAGYGLAPSRVVALQASFQERHPTSFALTATSSAQDRGKSHIALQFEGTKGVELFELNLKPPQAPKAAGAEGAGGGGDTWSSVLDSFPKVGIFGVALVGVVMWNMRKVSSQQKRDKGGGLDDFDEELFRERLREHRERKAAEQAAGAPSGGGGSSDGDLGPKGADLGEQDD